MATEVLTGYTEQDTGGVLAETSSRATFTGLSRNTVTYLYKDFGADHFTGSSLAEFEAKFDSSAVGSTSSAQMLFSSDGTALSSTNGDSQTLDNTAGFMMLAATSGAATWNAYAVGRVGGAAITSVNAVTTMDNTTVYGVRTGHLTSLGRYGGTLTQIFSSNTMATWVAGAALIRTTAAFSGQYFMPVVSTNTASTSTITGYFDNITLSSPAAGADMSAYTLTGNSAKLTGYADCAVATTLSISSIIHAPTYLTGDAGAGYFGNYTVGGVLNVTAWGGATSVIGYFSVLCVCDGGADARVANNLQGVVVSYASATTCTLAIEENIAGVRAVDTTSLTLDLKRPYWLELTRSGTSVTLNVYNDPSHLSLNQTRTWTGRDSTAYRYIMPVTTNQQGATDRNATFTFGGLTGAPVQQTYSYSSVGGVVLGGASTTIKGKVYSSTGGALVGGSSAYLRAKLYDSAGGIVFGGQSTIAANGGSTADFIASGGIILGGTSPVGQARYKTSTGGIVLGGTSPYSYNLQANVQEIVFKIVDSSGNPITGATTVTCKLRTTPGASLFDWNDTTFKTSGWTTVSATMTEVDATNLPGVYKQELNVGGFTNGRYQVFITYSATISQHGEIEFYVDDGQLVDEYIAGKVDLTKIDTTAILTDTAVIGTPAGASIAADIAETLQTGQFMALKG